MTQILRSVMGGSCFGLLGDIVRFEIRFCVAIISFHRDGLLGLVGQVAGGFAYVELAGYDVGNKPSAVFLHQGNFTFSAGDGSVCGPEFVLSPLKNLCLLIKRSRVDPRKDFQ